MILERFGAVSFVGDATMRALYTGLNILIHEDLVRGGMRSDAHVDCMCNKQIVDVECIGKTLRNSNEARLHTRPEMEAVKFFCSGISSRQVQSPMKHIH